VQRGSASSAGCSTLHARHGDLGDLARAHILELLQAQLLLRLVRDRAVPFSLEEEMMKRGAQYEVAALPFISHVVEDGLLITGQNPASARAVAEAVVRKLRAT
jgi:putative intracellular protease/amidase